ncbi:Baeyer-Villiger monooxygenase [Mycobacterium kiyosense]|uniref:Baeyer-Villiger monooxygenase n=1 Tax=Mycobacterium kiyosense TaxID=2871094 RepID=A0A9P3QAW5_9MYCO|nr:Baeyer-Villiger monooxygenase [Mycobacterium kiyosense]BDE16249.1 Baeyer-Villiger monooxygenase [Mycobacterium sp. 20KCMC460]GLB86073.1 Baeyer-Villiger monooxygenase [Mycobacterium kiyosense]GLB92764.1 Baeyer-Villiger monooxygenase [Mycobacterium kiyosense]GLB98679.1 Baeyer-Villiger monooxygenase [Mycobacterium kiyosense]
MNGQVNDSVRQERGAIVIGGGISGIAAVVRLRKEAGIDDVLLIEKSDGLGGTWNDNTYPGAACDIPSLLYSFEFAPNPNWSRMFAPQPEILAYVRRVADELGVTDRALLGTEVTRTVWDEDTQRWLVDTTNGAFAAATLVFGVGALNEPFIPNVPGVADFQGVQFHSARWNHDHDLRGKRVAVVGSAATAVQVVPSIQPDVAHLTYLQRTAGWVMPKPDWRTSRLEYALYRRSTTLLRFARWLQFTFDDLVLMLFLRVRLARLLHVVGRLHLLASVRDPKLRRTLTPHHVIGCKRFMTSNVYYPALTRTNVTVVGHGLKEVRKHSIVAEDGSEHEVDTIIWATGFHTVDPPFLARLLGRNGRTLAEVYGDNPKAYMGSSVPGFPNAYQIWGPNAGTGCNFVMVQAQLNYIVAALRTRVELGAASLDIRAEVVDAWKQEQREKHAKAVFGAGGCDSWYQDPSGDVHAVYAGTMRHMLRRSRRVDATMFHATTRRALLPAVG